MKNKTCRNCNYHVPDPPIGRMCVGLKSPKIGLHTEPDDSCNRFRPRKIKKNGNRNKR